MKKYVFLFIFFASPFFLQSLKAEVKLPSIFGTHMVLQQQSEVPVWGTASARKIVKITTSWDHQNYSVIADKNGGWKIKVRTPTAGGPYSMTVSDGKPLVLNDVLVGEVWVCSGQSNMEMTMKGYINQPVLGANEAIANSRNNKIRLFTVEKGKSLAEQDDFSGKWEECLPGNMAKFSATAYFFGRMLEQNLGVPVGLICSSWGGTRIEPWISEDGLKPFNWVRLSETKTDDFSQQTPSVLFNAMIHPMIGFGIRGVIWYQGESNRGEPKEYEKLMPGLIADWRGQWGIGDFPFYYVQIAPFNYGGGLNSAFLREAQLEASTVLPNTGMTCLVDIGEWGIIHPSNKKITGERLAYWALAKTYDVKGIACSGPTLKDMTIEGGQVKLTFNHAENGLTTFGKEMFNFYMSGDNQRFYQAKAIITGEGITLISRYVPHPVAVRYAFDDFVVGELYNTEGLPASSFRTDNWDIK